MELEQPIIVVNVKYASPLQVACVLTQVFYFSYRLGLLGFAASAALEESNRQLGEEGVGNYGAF